MGEYAKSADHLRGYAPFEMADPAAKQHFLKIQHGSYNRGRIIGLWRMFYKGWVAAMNAGLPEQDPDL